MPADVSLDRLHRIIQVAFGWGGATPPEDCGDIWSYMDLLEVPADPAHPEHANSLDWLVPNSADEFDPAAFDAPGITEVLSNLP